MLTLHLVIGHVDVPVSQVFIICMFLSLECFEDQGYGMFYFVGTVLIIETGLKQIIDEVVGGNISVW